MVYRKVQINQNRLLYLLKLFSYKKEKLLEHVNSHYKRPKEFKDLFNDEIDIGVLKKIDALFQQGLSYYTDPTDIEPSGKNSIFFRKRRFNTTLVFGDYLRVNAIEREAQHLNALVKLCNYPIGNIPFNDSLDSSPDLAAKKAIAEFYPEQGIKDDRDFLKAFIHKLSEKNIVVFEYVETWNQNYKSSLDGLFIKPNIIAIKRQQDSLKREIFTLAHELGHCILSQEEIDQPVIEQRLENETEKWCNDFAFAFLIGPEKKRLLLQRSDFSLQSSYIRQITQEQHLSRLAIFTFLWIHQKISWVAYQNIKKQLKQEYESRQKKKEEQKIRNKESGIKQRGGPPKPIHSKLAEDIYRSAFLNNVVKEYEVLMRFGKKDIDNFIYG